jgi:hypothetical protein
MLSVFRRMRAWHLLVGWGVYWTALVVVGLGPGLLAAWRVTDPQGHGAINGSMGDGVLRLTVSDATSTLWTGAASVATLMLWIAGPPLVLWLVWLLSRPRSTPPTLGDSMTLPTDRRALDQPRSEWTAAAAEAEQRRREGRLPR